MPNFLSQLVSSPSIVEFLVLSHHKVQSGPSGGSWAGFRQVLGSLFDVGFRKGCRVFAGLLSTARACV